jgi:hypothetical protein
VEVGADAVAVLAGLPLNDQRIYSVTVDELASSKDWGVDGSLIGGKWSDEIDPYNVWRGV